MARKTEEWIGKNDDTPVPPRVRDRVIDRCDSRCHKCTRPININGGESYTLEHLLAIINGGHNRESNLCLTCDNCLPSKNKADMAVKKKNTAVRYRARGIKPKKSRPIQGGGFLKSDVKFSTARGVWIYKSTGEALDPQPED